jgi:pantothenate kinase
MTVIPRNTAWNAKLTKGPTEIYRQEAARLRMLAGQHEYSGVRDSLLDMARQYDVLSSQANNIRQHTFGQPFRRRAEHEGR